MKHLAYESDKPETEEFARGVEAVRFIRCMRHREDSQLNFEAEGCECAVCEVKAVVRTFSNLPAAPKKAPATDLVGELVEALEAVLDVLDAYAPAKACAACDQPTRADEGYEHLADCEAMKARRILARIKR